MRFEFTEKYYEDDVDSCEELFKFHPKKQQKREVSKFLEEYYDSYEEGY